MKCEYCYGEVPPGEIGETAHTACYTERCNRDDMRLCQWCGKRKLSRHQKFKCDICEANDAPFTGYPGGD